MNFFQHECCLHARVPRVKLDDGKVRLIAPPWNGKLDGFTLLFEAFLLQMCRSMPVHHTGLIQTPIFNLLGSLWRDLPDFNSQNKTQAIQKITP